MSRQREARGSSDGTGEGEAGKGAASKSGMRSVESMRYLVSRMVRCWRLGLDNEQTLREQDKRRNMQETDLLIARNSDFFAALDFANGTLPEVIKFSVSHTPPAFFGDLLLQVVLDDFFRNRFTRVITEDAAFGL